MYSYDYDYSPYRSSLKKVRKQSNGESWWTKVTKSVINGGRDFCNWTSIHGFNHIAAPRRLPIERLLWLCACALAIWGALDVSIGQLQRYNESPTVVTLEKDFRSWRFNLPAVTSCYMNRMDMKKLPAVIKKYWGIDVHDEQYAYYTRFVNAVASSDLFHLQKFEEFKEMDLNVDMFNIAVDVMPDAVFKTMSSEGSSYKWWPVMTEAGACYVTNSVAFMDMAIVKPNPNETASSPVTCKYSSLSCYIMVDVNTNVDFYVHSPYDVVDLSDAQSTVYLTLTRVTELSIMETHCGRGVKELKPKRRGCLYTDEPSDAGRQLQNNTLYTLVTIEASLPKDPSPGDWKGEKVYSTNTCRLSCRSRLAKKLCGCIPFYYFYEEGPSCTPAGMWCLSRYSSQITSGREEKCNCAPQCVDSVFREISITDQIWDKGPFMTRGSAKFTVQVPRTRYTREIVFHFQDLVVSFGGAAGLFLGASFISFVEILYFLMARFFRAFVKKKNDQKITSVKIKPAKQAMIPYETQRMKALTEALRSQNQYDDIKTLYF